MKHCLVKLRYFLFSLKDDSTLFLIYLILKSILALILIFLLEWALINPIFGVDFDSWLFFIYSSVLCFELRDLSLFLWTNSGMDGTLSRAVELYFKFSIFSLWMEVTVLEKCC